MEEAAEMGRSQGLTLLPDMPELPEPEPTPPSDAVKGSTADPEKSPEDKARQSALQGLIIELGNHKIKDREAQLSWINTRQKRKVESRKDLTVDEISALQKQLKERQAGEE
jgi:hypothetical protein